MKIKDFTTGVQHIGIPTNDINKTIEFYHALGFETALRTVNGTEEVAFLQLHNLIIETYQNHQAKMEYGAIDHIAIDKKPCCAIHRHVCKEHRRSLPGSEGSRHLQDAGSAGKWSSILGERRKVLHHRRSKQGENRVLRETIISSIFF